MATSKVILALDSGALIAAEKGQKIEAVIRKWIAEGAEVIIPAPCLAETIRGSAKDAAVNRIAAAVDVVLPLTPATARAAGALLGATRRADTVDAMVVAIARSYGVTDIVTSDPSDLVALAGISMNVIAL